MGKTNYQPVDWRDAPSTATPRNARNLNRMDKGIVNLDIALEDVQGQINNLVVEGDSSVEAAQARNTYPTLKARLDTENETVMSQLRQIDNETVKKSELTNDKRPKGNSLYSVLPTTNNQLGDYFYCSDGDGTNPAGNYAWNGTSWYFSGTGDQGYNLVKADLDSKIKLDTSLNIFDGNYGVGAVSNTDGIYKYTLSTYVLQNKDKFPIGVVAIKPNTQYTMVCGISDALRIATHSTKNITNGELFDGAIKIESTVTDKARAIPFITGGNDKYLFFQTSSIGRKPFVQIVEGIVNEYTVTEYPFYVEGLGLTRQDVENTKADISNIKNTIKDVWLYPYHGFRFLAFGNSGKNIELTYNRTTKMLINKNPFTIVLGQGSTLKATQVIPAFELSLASFQMVYILKSYLESGATLSLSNLLVKEYYSGEWYNPNTQIPLFWCSNGYDVFNNMGITINYIQNNSSDNKKRYVWLGDSISKLKLLPHRVGDLTNSTVYDCSVAGSVMCNQVTKNLAYEQLGFKYISQSIVSGDYSIQDTGVSSLVSENPSSDVGLNIDTLKNVDFNTVDYMVLLYGTNDYTHGVITIAEYKQIMTESLTRVMTTYPNIKIYVISPLYRTNGNSNNPQGKKLVDYVVAEKEVCESLNIPFYDLYHNSNINAVNASYYLNADGLHQNDKGDILLAEKCTKFLQSN